jgi:VIT1/CCC1 family predicted Fe2+/Mn2+ transporter
MARQGGTRHARVIDRESPFPQARSLRQTTVIAVSALAGCVLLIGAFAVLSLAWTVHPLLTIVAAVALFWVGARLAGWCFAGHPRRT